MLAVQTNFSQSGNYFGHSEGSHLYGEQDYLHYYANHAPEAMNWMYGVIAQTKAQAMVGIRSNLKKRKKQALDSLKLNANDEATIQALEDGTLFKGLGDLNNVQTEMQNDNLSIPDTIEEARSRIKNIDTSVASVEDFISQLYKAIEEITGLSQQSLKDIAAYIIEQASGQTHNNGIATHAKNGGGIGSAILESVLAKYNQGFFQTVGRSQNVHTDIAKMLAVAESLPEPSSTSFSYTVRHGSGKAKTVGTVTGTNQILEALQEKFLKYFTEIEKAAAEAAVVVAALKAHPKLFKELENEVHTRIRQTGTQNVSVNLFVDPRQRSLIEQAGLELSRMTSKRMKSDVSLEVVDGGGDNATVLGQVGLSVKDYKDLKMSDDGTRIISGSLDIQKGTPLLTALVREANISLQNLHYIYQFAGAHTYGDGIQTDQSSGDEMDWNENYDQAWNELIQYLSYRMFVNALIGLEGTFDQAMYLVINRRIYDVVDFLNSFIGSKQSEIKITEYLGEYATQQASGGLIRKTYVDVNKWEVTSGGYTARNKILAKRRSEKAEAAISRIMGSTKLRISLNLINMQNLRALNF